MALKAPAIFGSVLLAVYLLLMAAEVTALVHWRQRVLSDYNSQDSQDWQQWVDEAQRQSEGEGPVYRRAPQHADPPLFLLMRDSFPACVVGAVMISSALYASLAYLLYGALLRGRPTLPEAEPKEEQKRVE